MKNPIFSVIILSYNQKGVITNAIDSCLKQNFQNFELIIVDDCSTDGTLEILKLYKKKFNNIKLIIHTKNKSSHVARCSGVEAARGKYTLFLDGDDTFLSESFDRLYQDVINKYKFDVAELSYIINEKIVNPDENLLNISRMDYFCTINANPTIWNKVYDTKLLKKAFSSLGNEYVNMSDDLLESISIAYFTKKYIQANIPIINYSVGNGVSTKIHNYEDNKKNCSSIKNMLNMLHVFCMNNKISCSDTLLNICQNHELIYMLNRIKFDTIADDIIPSYLLLTQTFDDKVILPYFEDIYHDALNYRNGFFSLKNFCRRIYNNLKKLIKRGEE